MLQPSALLNHIHVAKTEIPQWSYWLLMKAQLSPYTMEEAQALYRECHHDAQL